MINLIATPLEYSPEHLALIEADQILCHGELEQLTIEGTDNEVLGGLVENYEHFSGIKTQFVTGKEFEQLARQKNILGVISYVSTIEHTNQLSFPHLMIQISATQGMIQSEIWYGTGLVNYGNASGISFGTDGEHLFGVMTYAVEEDDIHAAQIENVYRNIFAVLRQNGYPHLYRMWNYIPGINQDNKSNVEIYKDFCYGRSVAFASEFTASMKEVLPAATGIGSIAQRVAIYFLAKKTPNIIHVENPMQVPAYLYPLKYGIKPPSFSRATYIPVGKNHYQFFLSGTASVVGHHSRHLANIAKQCETTFLNIQHLISEPNLKKYGIVHKIKLADLDSIKIYIRNLEDFPVVQRICAKFLAPGVSIIYLHADICRSELLVEVEGIFSGTQTQ